MLKSICIKTNNIKIIDYLLNELEHFQLENVYFSCYKFSKYYNVIIHYHGNSIENFFMQVSNLLAYLVLDCFENNLLKNIIYDNYFYFSNLEQAKISSGCIATLNSSDNEFRFSDISSNFYNYFLNNKSLQLEGFVNFRLNNYMKFLDDIVDLSVNKFIIDKEYTQFVELLKSYIASSNCNAEEVHLLYKNKESILLDENKNKIELDNSIFNSPFISDISFSSNDFTLNALLTLLPKVIYIHLSDVNDEFIDSLKVIFGKRIIIFDECTIR